MILALPFDLRLWTGVNGDANTAEIYLRFAARRDSVQQYHRKITNMATPYFSLRIPMTQALYEQLSMIPSWTDIQRGTPLYRLKRDVLALLRSKQEAAGLMLYINASENVYQYTWNEPADFFPLALTSCWENWLEMVGICAFESAISARDFPQPVPLLGCCVVTHYADVHKAHLTRSLIDSAPAMERKQCIPLLSQLDAWAWERMVRTMLWDDERLPFGLIGYCPPEPWQMGERPSHYDYRDRWGGIWQWEGGRAMDERNPFGGHWNVQLPDASVRRRWVNWIQQCTGRTIATSPDRITHINIEPDGCIGDMTFNWQE